MDGYKAVAYVLGIGLLAGVLVNAQHTELTPEEQAQRAAEREERDKIAAIAAAEQAKVKAAAAAEKAKAKAAAAAEREAERTLFDAKYTCQTFVKRQLKAPSTAKFQRTGDTQAALADNGLYQVVGYVDAQNSFGAQIRTVYHCTMRATEDQWILVRLKT